MLPGWYGFGTAIEEYRNREGDAGLATLLGSNEPVALNATVQVAQENRGHVSPV
jgi:hypothetical protein